MNGLTLDLTLYILMNSSNTLEANTILTVDESRN